MLIAGLWKVGALYAPEPRDILFASYVQEWFLNVWSHYAEGTKKDDYKLIINSWLVPHFKEMTFFQISGVEIQKFISSIKWRKGPKKKTTTFQGQGQEHPDTAAHYLE